MENCYHDAFSSQVYISFVSSKLSNFISQTVKSYTFCTVSSHCPQQFQKQSLLQPLLLCQIRWSTLLQTSALALRHSSHPLALSLSQLSFSSQHINNARSSPSLTGPTHFRGGISNIQRIRALQLSHPSKPIRTSQLCGLICSHLVLQES